MNLNFYGLPEFVSYSILLAISLVLIRQKQEIRLRYWLAGWLLVLLHAGIFMLLPQRFPFDVLARGTLALAGQVFVLAAYYQGPATIGAARLMLRVGLSGMLNLTFAVASAAYTEVQPAGQQMGLFYLLTALGATAQIACGPNHSRGRTVSCQRKRWRGSLSRRRIDPDSVTCRCGRTHVYRQGAISHCVDALRTGDRPPKPRLTFDLTHAVPLRPSGHSRRRRSPG